VLWSEKDREMLKELKENGFEKVQILLAKDAEIQKLKEEKEELLSENQKLKEEKEILEEEIQRLEKQKENATTAAEKEETEAVILRKINELQEKANEIAIIDSCVSGGLSKQQQKEINEEARRIVKQELENRLSVEQARQQANGKSFSYQLVGFEGYSNSPMMKINEENYPIVVKSYKKQSEQFNINAIEWGQIITQPNSLFLVWDGNKINYIDILELLKNQSHIDISFSTANLDIEERLNEFSQSMRYFKDIQFKFSSFHSSAFGQAAKLSNYFCSKPEDAINDNNSDVML
jgi:DNA repair exonuclease SbcCD ATPase subunit